MQADPIKTQNKQIFIKSQNINVEVRHRCQKSTTQKLKKKLIFQNKKITYIIIACIILLNALKKYQVHIQKKKQYLFICNQKITYKTMEPQFSQVFFINIVLVNNYKQYYLCKPKQLQITTNQSFHMQKKNQQKITNEIGQSLYYNFQTIVNKSILQVITTNYQKSLILQTHTSDQISINKNELLFEVMQKRNQLTTHTNLNQNVKSHNLLFLTNNQSQLQTKILLKMRQQKRFVYKKT
eukprot:TRINITY_DN16513_c2_g1_i1.p2 TRINITY_DN16513_c2_g1~~TRINITY_DN16513_c2_g1_i1.p2  ORF type:complete len:239 (+),score=-17.01 TRINITY_DN16513_c2_g1_i1:948-1664(+)